MLWQKLIGSGAVNAGLRFVGAVTAPTSVPTANVTEVTLSLTGLTGGVGSAAASGDIVILAVTINRASDITSFSASGYTLIADLYSNGTNDTNLAVFYKVLTAADTTANIQFGISTVLYCAAAYVWRGGNTTTPLDATTTTATNTASGTMNSPSITTVTADAVVISVGGCAGTNANFQTSTVPSGMENFVSAIAYDTSGNKLAQLAIASVDRATTGAYDPAAFGGGFSGTSSTMGAATIALRPK